VQKPEQRPFDWYMLRFADIEAVLRLPQYSMGKLWDMGAHSNRARARRPKYCAFRSMSVMARAVCSGSDGQLEVDRPACVDSHVSMGPGVEGGSA
jgi:hypothetical protein